MSGKRHIRLQILSDLHLEFGDYTPTQTNADVVILAGDIHVGCKGIKWVQKHFPDKPVIYVMGNHEFYGHSISTVFKEFRAKTETGNICLLENQSVQIGDWTFLGCSLWTDFALWPTPFAAMLAAGKSMTDFRIRRQIHRILPAGQRCQEGFDAGDGNLHDQSMEKTFGPSAPGTDQTHPHRRIYRRPPEGRQIRPHG